MTSQTGANAPQSPGAPDASPATDQTPVTTTFLISGMTCGHCEQAVTEEVSQLDGVASVSASSATGRATVTSAAPLDDAAVRAAVDEAGYELVGRA